MSARPSATGLALLRAMISRDAPLLRRRSGRGPWWVRDWSGRVPPGSAEALLRGGWIEADRAAPAQGRIAVYRPSAAGRSAAQSPTEPIRRSA